MYEEARQRFAHPYADLTVLPLRSPPPAQSRLLSIALNSTTTSSHEIMPNATSTVSSMILQMVSSATPDRSKFMVLDLKTVVRNVIDTKSELPNTQTWKLRYDTSNYAGDGMVEVMRRMDIVVTGDKGREAFGVRKSDR